MSRFRACGIFALVLIFESVDVIQSRTSNASKTSEEANKTEGRYSVEFSDYAEVPSFKNHVTGGHFDYYDFVPEIGVDVKNRTGSVLSKCCGWNYYFDVGRFSCVPLKQNVTPSDFFGWEVEGYSFVESIPECDNGSVLSVWLSSRVSVGVAGVVVDGVGIFSKYCIDGSPEHSVKAVVLACRDPRSFCTTRTCFRKCCPLGYSYGFSERKCRKSKAPFNAKFYDLETFTRVEGPLQFGVYMGDACGTKGKYLLERDLGEMSYLGLDGTLYAPAFERRTFSNSEFCLEFVNTGNRSGVESFLCFSKTGAHFENSQLQYFLLSLGFIISCMFLLFTFLVYLLSPPCQNLYGKTLMCYVACLFTAYLCLAVIELRSKEIDKTACTTLGYALLFSFLAAFFWLNVMSFDIWKTFRTCRSMERGKPEKGTLRFFWYSLYAWSFPAAITAVCVYANQAENFPYETVKPDIGEEKCWFSKKRKGIYVFFIAPISLVIMVNVIFYIQTAWKIWKVKADVKKMERQKKKRFSANKDEFIINGKLFVVMGITWSLEIISYFAPHPIWYITDTANALHGVFIFAVFVLKKKVLHQVSEQVRAALKRTRQLTTSNSDDLSGRKNFQDLNTEGRTCATGTFPSSDDSKK